MNLRLDSFRILNGLIFLAAILLAIFQWDVSVGRMAKADMPLARFSTATNTTGLPLKLPDGFSISTFAKNLNNPGSMTWDNKGNLLVAETSKGRIMVLQDVNYDGIADKTRIIASGLDHPESIAVKCGSDHRPVSTVNDLFYDRAEMMPCKLYVKESSAIISMDYDGTEIAVANRIIFSEDDDSGFFALNANATEAPGRCSTTDNTEPEVALFCVSPSFSYTSIPQDENYFGMTVIPEYGWPKNYANNVIMTMPMNPDFEAGDGYKVTRYIFDSEKNYVGQEDFITGWVNSKGNVKGFPADLIVQSHDGKYISDLYISDKMNGTIYRVFYRGTTLTSRDASNID